MRLLPRHLNVAQLVGETRGPNGLNGIVVKMGKPDAMLRVIFSCNASLSFLFQMVLIRRISFEGLTLALSGPNV